MRRRSSREPVPFRSTVQYALRVTPLRLVILVCAAQVCAQIGAYTWPALLPTLIPAWGLSNSEAGWVTGLFYAAYTVSVPILVTLTDRIDTRARGPARTPRPCAA